MVLKLEQDDFMAKAKAVGRLLTDKKIQTDDSFFKLVKQGNKYLFAGVGDGHTLYINVAKAKKTEKDKSVNVEYLHLWNIIGYLRGEVETAFTDNGITLKDEKTMTRLSDVMSDNDDLESFTNLQDDIKNLKGTGHKIERQEFYDTVSNLRAIQERDERTDIETGIMLTDNGCFVTNGMYVVKYYYKTPMSLILDAGTTKVLLELLNIYKDEEHFEVIIQEDMTYFLIGDAVYIVQDLDTYMNDVYDSIFKHIDTGNKIEMDRAECLRILNLAKVLTDSTRPDIEFHVTDGEGKIYVENGDGDVVDGKFQAQECEDISFTVTVDDMVSVISRLNNTVGKDILFEVVNVPSDSDEQDLLHLHHSLGECVFSINTDFEEE